MDDLIERLEELQRDIDTAMTAQDDAANADCLNHASQCVQDAIGHIEDVEE